MEEGLPLRLPRAASSLDFFYLCLRQEGVSTIQRAASLLELMSPSLSGHFTGAATGHAPCREGGHGVGGGSPGGWTRSWGWVPDQDKLTEEVT